MMETSTSVPNVDVIGPDNESGPIFLSNIAPPTLAREMLSCRVRPVAKFTDRPIDAFFCGRLYVRFVVHNARHGFDRDASEIGDVEYGGSRGGHLRALTQAKCLILAWLARHSVLALAISPIRFDSFVYGPVDSIVGNRWCDDEGCN